MSSAGQPDGDAAGSSASALLGRPTLGDAVVRADRALFAAGRAHRSGPAVSAARTVSGLAEPRIVYPGLAAVAVFTARRAGWRAAFSPCLVVASGAAARHVLAGVIARPRPPADAWLAPPKGFSLPSRHVTLATLAAGVAVRALGVRGRPGQAAPLLAAAGVGASRVCLGVHWPGDVLAGLAFAEVWLRLTGRWQRAPAAAASGQP